MNPTPAQLLACEIVASFRSAMAQAGMDWDHQCYLVIEARIARKIQQLIDAQHEQSDAQAFGDEPEQCECMNPLVVTVTIAPLFQEPNGLN